MNAMSLLIAAIVLLGCMALKGVNPFDAAMRALIWVLYRTAAVSLTLARTTDSAYFALRREYRRSVEQIDQERAAFQRGEEARIPGGVRLQSSRAFAYQVGRDFDAGHKSRIDSASCLLHASDAAVQVALEAIQTLGGNGYINEYPTGRILRDAKLYAIGAGTNEIRRMLIGRELFDGKS